MNKPTAKPREPLLNFHEIIKFIEEKYKINTRDYLNLFGTKDRSESHFHKYQKITGDVEPFGGHYPDCPENTFRIYKDGKMINVSKEEYDADFKLIHEHYQRYLNWCQENPENTPPKYLDYWHWLIDDCFSEVRNGSEQYWTIVDILEGDAPQWVKDITQLVYNEFKEELDNYGGLDVWISW